METEQSVGAEPHGVCPRCRKPSTVEYFPVCTGSTRSDIVIEFCLACKIRVERECCSGRCKYDPCVDLTWEQLNGFTEGFEELSHSAWPLGPTFSVAYSSPRVTRMIEENKRLAELSGAGEAGDVPPAPVR